MQKRLYNLDGLRFMAAWIVLLCHLEVLKPYFGFSPVQARFFSNGAQIAVTFFFVLSGFLISYLLLKEKKANPADRINVKKFYLKRILRIWPLYYLLVVLAFFVLNKYMPPLGTHQLFPDAHPSAGRARFLGYICFLPNS